MLKTMLKKRFFRVFGFRLITILLVSGLLIAAGDWLPAAPCRAAQSAKQVLVLHSYHQGQAWTDDIMAGIGEVLGESGEKLELHVEYLDATRYPGSTEIATELERLLRFKQSVHPYDLILITDDDALNFVLARRNQLFSGVPVVFCGVNNPDLNRLAGYEKITGMMERPGFLQTAELALVLHPGTEKLVILLSSRNASDQALRRQVLNDRAILFSRVASEIWSDLTVEEIEARLAGMPSGVVVIYLASNLQNSQGRMIGLREGMRRVAAAKHPVYSCWDIGLGTGIVGGIVISGRDTGKAAARLGLELLRNTPFPQIPKVLESRQFPVFDYLALQHFGIGPNLLPEDSIILHMPPDFYQINKAWIWFILVGLLVLAFFGAPLLWNVIRRKKAEAALAESEERLRLALEGAREGLWDWDVVTGRNIVDEMWCAILGYRKEEIREDIEQWESLIHPLDLSSIQSAHRECLEGRRNYFAGEFRMRAKSGQWIWILGRGKVVDRDRCGKPLRLVGTHQDISPVKQAQADLKNALEEVSRAKHRIDVILAAIGDGVIALDRRGLIKHMNRAAERLLDKTQDQVQGQALALIAESPVLRDCLEMILKENQQGQTCDVPLGEPVDGRQRLFEVRIDKVLQPKDSSLGWIVVLQDVTEIREMDRMKSEFISTAAHELRSPLTPILGYAALLENNRDLSQDERDKVLATIAERARALNQLVDELLDLSRLESGQQMVLNRSSCSPEILIEPLVTLYQGSFPGYRFHCALRDAQVPLPADQVKVRQVLENLLSNAVKYSAENTLISISGQRVEDTYRIMVADQGVGMTPQQVERVFDKFYRADAENPAIKGIGLGMTIARGIVEAHGGAIEIESEPGRGTRVWFSLPLAEASVAEAAEVSS